LITETQVNDNISSCLEVRGLELLNKRPSVRSLLDTNELPTDKMHLFLMNSRNILESLITGCKEFSGSFLQPKSENIRLKELIYDLLVNYYENIYIYSIFRRSFTEDLPNLTIVINKVNRYERYQISTEIFGFTASL